MVQSLREAGFKVEWAMTPGGGSKQWKIACELGASHVLCLVESDVWELRKPSSKEARRCSSKEVLDALV
jgi:hypothetical protein